LITFFFCANCQSEKPRSKRRVIGHKTTCTDCIAAAAEYKRTGVMKTVSPYSRVVGHKQDSWESEIPAYITESYQESLAD
jgi:hypothetical protein